MNHPSATQAAHRAVDRAVDRTVSRTPTPTPTAKVKPMAQQQTDFTSEGAPPPGKVATKVPATPVSKPWPVAAPPLRKGPPSRSKY